MKRGLVLTIAGILCLCGCSRREQPRKPDATCEITWVVEEEIPAGNVKAVNDLLQKKGYDLSLTFLRIDGDPTGENPDKYRNELGQLATEKKADIASLGWGYVNAPGSCSEFLRKGYSYTLDDWLETKEGKKVFELYDQEIWDTCRIDGKIVAFPNESQVVGPATVVGFNENYVSKEQVDQWDGSWKDLFRLMQEITLPEDVYMVSGYPTIDGFMDAKAGEDYLLQDKLVYDLQQKQFTHLFDVEEFYEYLCFLHQCWEEKYMFDVYMDRDELSSEIWDSMEQGNYAVDILADANRPEDHVIYVEAPSYLIENNLGTQTIVLKDSPHVEESLRLLAALRTDDELANALVCGQEGQDYSLNDEGKIEGGTGIAGVYLNLADGILPDAGSPWDDFRAHKKSLLQSDKRISSGIAGFYPDYSAVRQEMTDYLQILGEYENCWQDKDFKQKYQEGKEKLDKQAKPLLDEVQKQLEEWRGNQ